MQGKRVSFWDTKSNNGKTIFVKNLAIACFQKPEVFVPFTVSPDQDGVMVELYGTVCNPIR